MQRNMERMSADVDWLIEKFDYLNKDADWKIPRMRYSGACRSCAAAILPILFTK